MSRAFELGWGCFVQAEFPSRQMYLWTQTQHLNEPVLSLYSTLNYFPSFCRMGHYPSTPTITPQPATSNPDYLHCLQPTNVSYYLIYVASPISSHENPNKSSAMNFLLINPGASKLPRWAVASPASRDLVDFIPLGQAFPCLHVLRTPHN